MTDSERLSIQNVAPEAYQAVYGLEQYIRKHLPSELLHLIKLRASILNGCSFCVDMHSREGLTEGMDTRKLFAVGAWRDAPFFDARERAALELTDAVTRLGTTGSPTRCSMVRSSTSARPGWRTCSWRLRRSTCGTV